MERRALPSRAMGAVLFDEGRGQFSSERVPADVYDLLVYFREAHPSRLLARN